MATVDFLNKRIDGKKKEIEKLEKKLERINKAKETNWKVNPYYYSDSDLKWTLRDLESAKKSLEAYENELVATIEKDNSRNVPAILEFLERWKKRVFEFYDKDLKQYYKEYEELTALRRENSAKYGYYLPKDVEEAFKEKWEAFKAKTRGYYRKVTVTNRFGKEVQETVKERDGEWEHLNAYINRGGYNDAISFLKKELEEEAKAKYDFIIERVNAICGTITDASNLSVGEKGDLNGIINGERGDASVKTIGAGGYNIQCYHFRTLIHKVK